MWRTAFDSSYVGLTTDGAERIVTQTKIRFIGQPSTPLHNFLVVLPLDLSLDVSFVCISHRSYICDKGVMPSDFCFITLLLFEWLVMLLGSLGYGVTSGIDYLPIAAYINLVSAHQVLLKKVLVSVLLNPLLVTCPSPWSWHGGHIK